MKKYFGLSNREEAALGYLVLAEELVNGLGLVLLNISVIAATFLYTKNSDFVALAKSVFGGYENQKFTGKINTKVALWSLTSLLLVKTLAYFGRKYIESRVIADYADTEGMEKR